MDIVRNFTLGDLLRENARSYPDRVALVCEGERWTFPEANVRVNRLAAGLAAAGVRRGARVLWLAQNCHRLIELMFACAKLGAAVAPANWRQSPEEMAYVIGDAAAPVVFWQEEEIGPQVKEARELAGDAGRWVRHDAAGPDTYEGLLASGTEAEPEVEVDEDEPVVHMYTAAFEGRPRGALLTHRNLVTTNLHLALVHGLTWEDAHLAAGPLFHVLTVMTTLAVLHVGGKNVVVRRVIPEEMCRLIDAEQVTRAVVLGPTIAQMVEAAERGGYNLKSLQTIPVRGGGPAMEKWAAMTSPTLPHLGGFGQTECAGQISFNAYGPPGTGGHGRSAPLAIVRVVDEEGRELPPGEVGEIVARGPQVMAAYHALPEVNADRFRGGWHHTTDLGRREPDGSITFIGPKTELIKTGAENVYPAEVEGVLLRHPAVREACVIGVPDPTWGQSVKAVVALREPGAASPDDLIEFCKQHIASYKKPKVVELVDALPRTAAGTVDRAALRRAAGGA